jgi:hypothetical protein
MVRAVVKRNPQQLLRHLSAPTAGVRSVPCRRYSKPSTIIVNNDFRSRPLLVLPRESNSDLVDRLAWKPLLSHACHAKRRSTGESWRQAGVSFGLIVITARVKVNGLSATRANSHGWRATWAMDKVTVDGFSAAKGLRLW